MQLNQVEIDFIEFMTIQRKQPQKYIEDVYLRTKEQFDFASKAYGDLSDKINNLHKILYDELTEDELIDSYRFQEVFTIFRFIAYSFLTSEPDLLSFIRAVLKDIPAKLSPSNIYKFILKRFKKLIPQQKTGSNRPAMGGEIYRPIAQQLVETLKDETPIVVDYGCGLGYISFFIAQLNRKAKIYLVDIDCLTLKFAEFRFKKHGINHEVIPVNKTEHYPALPRHNICIAHEVMEHVREPLLVYRNILGSMDAQGLFYGDFQDHQKMMFHVSPDLSELRRALDTDYVRLSNSLYQKK
jgi:2-polyprenyl-3-methyl-5-hydroxy-6-metoxy-1,4-benzoquinol methylase